MEDIHPIKPAINLPIFTETQIIIFWFFICLISCVIIYLIIKKYFFKKEKKIEPQKINYKLQALKKIKKVRKHIELDNLKEFHLEATNIIKEYAEKKHKVNFPKMTTQEITLQLDILKTEKEKLKDFLKKCDLIKFANKKSKTKLAENIYKTGVEIINKI